MLDEPEPGPGFAPGVLVPVPAGFDPDVFVPAGFAPDVLVPAGFGPGVLVPVGFGPGVLVPADPLRGAELLEATSATLRPAFFKPLGTIITLRGTVALELVVAPFRLIEVTAIGVTTTAFFVDESFD